RVDVDEVGDELQVGGVSGEQGDAVDVGGRGDGQVDCSPARPAATGLDGGGEPSPFAGDRRVDRQRLECGLDHAEPECSARALVLVAGDQDTEVQLGEAGGADRTLELA